MLDLSQIDLSKLTEDEKLELDHLLEQERIADLARDLYQFFLEAWKILEPITPLQPSWHYKYICEWLVLVGTGKFRKLFPHAEGLIVNVPPRSAKSTLISIIFPVWCWINNPTHRFICASYALKLAIDHSIKRRALILSSWYQQRWGKKFSLREDQNTKEEFFNDKTGQMICASVGSNLMGKGGNILILDDPLDPEQAASDAERNAANKWFEGTFWSRANDHSKDVFIIVMQRLHEDDVTGNQLLKNKDCAPGQENWIHVKIPLAAEDDTEIVYPVSKDKFIRPKGDILNPERNTPIVVTALKKKPKVFAGQFQQRPAPAEGNIIKRTWIKYWGDPHNPESPMLPGKFDRGLQSWDCSFKGNAKSDYVSGLVVGTKGPNRFLVDRKYKQMSFPETVKAILMTTGKYPWAREICIEDKANGPAIIDSLKQQMTGVIAINPRGDKKERLENASLSLESGNWYFPHPSKAPWVEEFIENLVTFPNARHDDDCDAWSQAENRIGQKGGPAAFLEAYDRMLKKKSKPEEAPPQEEVEAPSYAELLGEEVPPGVQVPVIQAERKLLAGETR